MKHDAFVPASDLTKLWRALIEFNMIEEGDTIAVGISGGKDSLTLLNGLHALMRFYSGPSRDPKTQSPPF